MNAEKAWSRNGLDCMVLTHSILLHRCGYAEIPEGHPAHGKGYDELPGEWHERVHGGLTFSGRVDGRWFAGFDCAHVGDAPDPSLARTPEDRARADVRAEAFGERHAWSLPEVELQVNALADLIAECPR